MIFYRVSRNSIREPNSQIWEVEVGPESLARLKRYKAYFGDRNWTEITTNMLVDVMSQTLSAEYMTGSVFKEAALEALREERYQSIPSRFERMMVFGHVQDAVDFKAQFRPEATIYKLEYPDTAEYFTSDMKILDQVPSFNLDGYFQMAENYWSTKMTDTPIEETLLFEQGESIVIEKLTE